MEKSSQAFEKLDLLNSLVSTKLYDETQNRVYHFPESIRYMNTFEEVRISELKCPICNDIMFREITHDPVGRGYKRISYICMNCGIMSDKPNDNLRLSINGPKHLKQGANYHYDVIISSKFSSYKSGYLSLVIVDGAKDSFFFDKNQQLFIIVMIFSQNYIGQNLCEERGASYAEK